MEINLESRKDVLDEEIVANSHYFCHDSLLDIYHKRISR